MERVLAQLNLKGKAHMMTAGSHCEVALHILDGHQCVVKIIRGHSSMDTLGATRLVDDIVSYQRLLSDIGVPIPRERNCFPLEDQGTQSTNVVLVESYEGEDAGDCLARMNDEQARFLVRRMLCAISPFLRARRRSGGPLLGIDPKPNNFAVNDAVTYVDTVPPRYRRDNETLVDLPIPTDPNAWKLAYWRAYTPEGVLVVLQTQLCRVRPDLLTTFVKEISAAASACGVGAYFECLPSRVFPTMSALERKAFVRSLEPTDMYLMRDIACFLAHRDSRKFDQPWLDAVFKQSHFKGSVSRDGFEHLKGELANAL
jgi:hypothetical protein